MNILKYNLINGPKKTVNDYLQTLNNDELQTVYSSSFIYNLKMPELVKKIQDELQKRKRNPEPVLS